MKAHLTRFRVTYITTGVAIASAVGAELAALKDAPPSELSSKSWVFWTCLVAAVVVSAGNNIIAALHEPPPSNPITKTWGAPEDARRIALGQPITIPPVSSEQTK